MQGWVTIGTELDTKNFDKQIEEVEYELKQIEVELRQKKQLKLDTRTVKEMELQAERLTNKLIDLKRKQDDLSKNNFSNISSNLQNIGNSVEGVTKKVTKWGLAIFGIRSAYMFIRQTMNQLAAENDQIAGDIEYMRWILAQTLKPVVEWIIKGLYFIIALINSISKALLGIDFLADKSADAFKRAKENTGGVSKNLKEVRKQLAGFDEMNVLQEDTSTSGGGAGLGDWEAPDLGDYTQDVENVANAWDKLRSDMEHTLSAPLDVWFEAFGGWGLAARGLTEFFHGFLDVVDGILKTIGGLFKFIWGLLTENDEMVNEGMEQMKEGVIEILKGLVEMIWGLIQTLVGIIVGLLWELVGSLFNIIKGVNDWIGEQVKNIINWLKDFIWKGLQGVGLLFLEGINWVKKNIIDKIVKFYTDLWNGLVKNFNIAINSIKTTFNAVVNFIKGIVDKIMGFFKSIGTNVGNVIGGAFKGVINGVLNAIENILNFPIRSINKLISTINNIPGINLGKLSTFSLPRLAKGGIVSMPGRGVPIGSAIAGERGREAVIPLTDSQQMALLGEAIGKYITINANITNTMNGRIISRELQRINSESDFSYNR